MLAFGLTRRRVCGAENCAVVLPHPPYGGKENFSNATRDRSPYGLRLYFGLTCCVLWAKIRHVGCNRAVRGRSSILRDCGLRRSFSPSAPVYLNSGLFHEEKPRYRPVAIASHKAKQPAKAVVPAEGARFVRSESDGRACFGSSVLRAESRRTQNRVTDLLQSRRTKQNNLQKQVVLAGETRFEHATDGFGDRCSTVEPLP